MLPGFLITVLTRSYIPVGIAMVVAIVVALVVTSSIFGRASCPQCKRRFNYDYRLVTETKGLQRLYYDCAECHVTWQTEYFVELDLE